MGTVEVEGMEGMLEGTREGEMVGEATGWEGTIVEREVGTLVGDVPVQETDRERMKIIIKRRRMDIL
jgi:hypothetical protein